MSSDPYVNKPDSVSDAGQWHEISFRISIDRPCDWDKVNLREWAQTVGKLTTLRMAETIPESKTDKGGLIKTFLTDIQVEALYFVTDTLLHELIDDDSEE